LHDGCLASCRDSTAAGFKGRPQQQPTRQWRKGLRWPVVHYDTSKVKLAKITKQAEVQLVKYLSCWWEFDISASIKLEDSNISCHK